MIVVISLSLLAVLSLTIGVYQFSVSLEARCWRLGERMCVCESQLQIS